MNKIIILLVIFLLAINKYGSAFHLKGGWIQYEYLSTDSTAKTNKYRITIRQYLSCSSTDQQIDATVSLGIFDGNTNQLFRTVTVPASGNSIISKTDFDPCITPKPTAGSVCYRIDVYTTIQDLPFNEGGYTLAVQRCCRISGIINVSNSDQFGLTYSNKIPGRVLGTWYANDNSPFFATKDTVIICHNTPFVFDFSATDADSDSLRYTFCDGLHGGSAGQGGGNPKPDPPSNPPYSTITYTSSFSGGNPLGFMVTIDSKTGIISGVAPNATGDYVIAVCVYEYRNGVNIGVTRKEIHINVANCQLSAADLKPTYITCDGFTLDFQNESSATSVTSYKWYFGDDSTSTSPTPTHTYKDTGVYNLKLVVLAQGCSDSAESIVKIFPGFVPDFTVTGFCFQTPFQFKNTTFAKYGNVDSVFWDFGETAIDTDTSTKFNPIYKYPNGGQRQVYLYAHSSKGCEKDITKTVNVLDKPVINLAFKDTLICSIDTLPLSATSTAGVTFAWTPNSYISNIHSQNPLVFPKDTTLYIVTVTDNGCINKDTVTVNVLDFITVDAGPNANVCLTDDYRMKTTSYALGYQWTPATTLDDSTKKFPIATPIAKMQKYYVTANLGKCQDHDSVTLFTFPYAKINLSRDTSICFGDSIQLFGSILADTFFWRPLTNLDNPKSLSPIVKPAQTTDYILTANYLTGCLKQVHDTARITVVQPFTVFAGRDTAVVYNQPLQLNAVVKLATDKQFQWTDIKTSSVFANIQNPVVTFPITTDSVSYKVKAYTKENCYAFDTIKIKVFKTIPSIFMPDAFTPNNDGLNDIIKPVCVGIATLEHFNIYNRWGQLLYTTSQVNKGWDGRFNGTIQNTGTYIYTVQGTDYLGNVITKKGTIVLIQ